MRPIVTALTLATLCGTTSVLAQPVARHLVDDANAIETLYTQASALPLLRTGSVFLLDDLDADGVREVLLTHIARPSSLFVDRFNTEVRSARTGQTMLMLAPETPPAPGAPLPSGLAAYVSAIQIGDIDGDGVRDIAATRALDGSSLRPRVYSGANGGVIRDLAGPLSSQFVWGLSLTEFDDLDDDGQPDLLMGHTAGGGEAGPFLVWSPASNSAALYAPQNAPAPANDEWIGVTILDLGADASGVRSLLSTSWIGNLKQTTSAAVFGGTPLQFLGGFSSPIAEPGNAGVHSGAARIGDLNADGFREIVLSGDVPSDADPQRRGLPVLSGNVDAAPPVIQPLRVHRPSVLIDRGVGPEVVQPQANGPVVGIPDATGDGVPDYLFLGRFENPFDGDNPCVVAVSGRTGQAFFAAQSQAPDAASAPPVSFTRPLGVTPLYGQASFVSPGDLNSDGTPDLLLLVRQVEIVGGSSELIETQLLLTHYLPTPCQGDTDFDRAVDFADLNAVLSNFGGHDITSPADLNASGAVDFADLNLVLSAFGQVCQ